MIQMHPSTYLRRLILLNHGNVAVTRMQFGGCVWRAMLYVMVEIMMRPKVSCVRRLLFLLPAMVAASAAHTRLICRMHVVVNHHDGVL